MTRFHATLFVTAAVLLAAAGASAIALARVDEGPLGARATRWSHDVRGDSRLVPLGIEDPDTHWRRRGFVELVTPMAPPTRSDGGSRIEVWLRIPDGAQIGLDPHGALVLPPGSEADRVERLRVDGAFVVGDVRGAQIAEDGRTRILRLLRPEHAGAGARLVGYAWSESDEGASARAHAALAELIALGGGFAEPKPARARARIASLFAARSDCTGCHERGRAARADLSVPGPLRATDAHGFYAVLATLSDASPLERYRPRETNRDRPHVTVSCPRGEPRFEENEVDGAAHYTCDGNAVPVGALDVRAALRAGDPRAAGVCAARRYLFDRMDARARRAFSQALAVCEPDVDPHEESSR